MKALVLVHAEPMDPTMIDAVTAGIVPLSEAINYDVVCRIAEHLNQNKSKYDYIAYLSYESKDWTSLLVHPEIALHQDELDFFEWDNSGLEGQVAALKKILFYKKIKNVDLAGFAVGCCIDDTKHWLEGNDVEAFDGYIEASETEAAKIAAIKMRVRVLGGLVA
jgi:hypothetical protein